MTVHYKDLLVMSTDRTSMMGEMELADVTHKNSILFVGDTVIIWLIVANVTY